MKKFLDSDWLTEAHFLKIAQCAIWAMQIKVPYIKSATQGVYNRLKVFC
jgi:hypothetical protein